MTTSRIVSVVPSSSTAKSSDASAKNASSEGSDAANDSIHCLDFIGPSHAVKDLFALPYTQSAVSVAVHNLEGTLLMEVDIEEPQTRPRSRRRRRLPSGASQFSVDMIHKSDNATAPSTTRGDDALAMVTSLLRIPPDRVTLTNTHDSSDSTAQTESNKGTQDGHQQLTLPPPEHYDKMIPLTEPRDYLSWKFFDHNLLVGSDAILYRSPEHGEAVVRVADVAEMRSLLQTQRDTVQRGHRVSDHQRSPSRSYAEALASNKGNTRSTIGQPDLAPVHLQTCIVPSSSMPLGALCPPASANEPSSTTSTASPVCTVLDAYLDNIIANVPQLALCLREKGFIQSVKLLRTEEIPTGFMHASTLDTSNSGTSTNTSASEAPDPIFSPQIMEMNASTLLRFLKANCTRDNATYLLRREQGQTEIHLYDISAISAQRQRKWIWWLAMMSYRFALRLRQLSSVQQTSARKRNFRSRQRSLFQTALDLLQDLTDMDGGAHETLCAAVREHLADTFLVEEADGLAQSHSSLTEGIPPIPSHAAFPPQPYVSLSADALMKAQDHLVSGIQLLWPLLDRTEPGPGSRTTTSPKKQVMVRTEESSSSDDDESSEPVSLEVSMQLLGLHHKLIHVSLRLAEHHLKNYFSSSAMHALRTAARRIADALTLLQPIQTRRVMEKDLRQLQESLRQQYICLWEHCGHFARSFAADELWRERGHACGDDVISVLRDVENALGSVTAYPFTVTDAPITKKTRGLVSLNSISAVVTVLDNHNDPDVSTSMEQSTESAIELTRSILNRQKLVCRDRRRVLVAACVSYSRAIGAFEQRLVQEQQMYSKADACPSLSHEGINKERTLFHASDSTLLSLLRQRLGDACNEIGKILLNELRTLLSTSTDEQTLQSPLVAAGTLLSSAQFWFLEGLDAFQQCGDLRNLALLRCNLCQCCKLRANSNFASQSSSSGSGDGTHAEVCLQEAADHLQMAHEALGSRDVDPLTWDMVSEELAATFLVLGVRRRQSLLGGGSTPVIMQALRLTPGKERCITDPMERALKIYEQSANAHQAAAVNYQLALFYSKVWTCQRDEAKTREKLSAAFRHYSAAHAYFSRAPAGNEPTFVILCLDLSNLYAAVSGAECLSKALSCCLDTADAFSSDAIDAAFNRRLKSASDWFEKMCTLASSVEDRIFKLLMSLVKIEKETTGNTSTGSMSYKELYRVALTAKMARKVQGQADNASLLRSFHELLSTINDDSSFPSAIK